MKFVDHDHLRMGAVVTGDQKAEFAAMDCTAWEPYFAWMPVYVDAYNASEIKNGKMSYRKWGWVERRFCVWVDVDDEDRIEHRVWRFRIARAR